MAAAPAEIPVGLTGNPSLLGGDRRYLNHRVRHEFIDSTAGDRIAGGVDRDGSLDEVHR